MAVDEDFNMMENILCQGKKIRQQLKNMQPGQTLQIGDAIIDARTPLMIKKGGPTVNIGDEEYTLNRLTGLCAAFAALQSAPYNPKCAMAVSLGLDIERDRILYYSATPGAEHFPEIFGYNPLLCAIKQLECNKVTKENISRIAAVKNDAGKTLSALMIDAKAFLPSKFAKFGVGGSRGIAELEKALTVVRNLSGSRGAASSR